MKYPYWNYFVALCNDLEKTTRFVEPTTDNYETYSIEYTRLYLAIGSEVDVVAKMLCEKINSAVKLSDIDSYRSVILSGFSDLPEVQVVVPRHELSFTPWQDWRNGTNPVWWKNHNKVKHKRNKNFKEANLENTLNALAGLLVIVGYLYADELGTCQLSPPQYFMQFDSKYYGGVALGREGNVPGYWLPGVTKPKRLLDIQKAAQEHKARAQQK